MADAAILSTNFRICVPKAVREKENWHPGQRFAFLPSEGGVLLVPIPSLAGLRGLAKAADRSGVRERIERS